MAEPHRRFGLPPELGVAALVVAASLPLGRLFRTGEIGSVALSAAGASTAVAWGLRRLRAPTLLAAVASFAAFLWFASLAFFRDAMVGPFPSARSLSLIWEAAVEGIRRSQTDAAPVSSNTSFLCLAAFAIWATAWLADDAANKLRHPMLAIGVTVPLFVLPGTILEGSNRWFNAAAYLAGALWVIFTDERFRLSRWGKVVGLGSPGWRPGLAARIGLLAILIAVLGTPILPGFSAPPGLRGATGSGDRIALNPLVSIRPQLADKRLIEVMTVRSRVAAYWRLTALDRFDGLTWTSGPQTPTLRLGERQITAQSTAPRSSLVEQRIEIRNLRGPWVPAAYEPVRVEGLRGIGADPTTRTLITSADLRRGTKYTVRSRIPTLTFEELDLAPRVDPAAFSRYLSLPRNPEMTRVASIARGVVDDAAAPDSSPLRQAVALQSYLRSSAFTYNEDVALAHDIDDILAFLVVSKEGYCEQFATAMAVMARTLGLPSRVAIGFAVGGAGSTADEYQVTSRHAHAWVEIWMSGFGWVPFEPTKRSDAVVVPPYTSPQSALGSPEAQPTPTAEETPESSPSPGGSPTSRRTTEPGPGAGGAAPDGRLIKVETVGAVLLGLLLLGVPVASRVRRLVRFRRAPTPHAKVSARYLDFLDWCAAIGRGRLGGETPIEHARRLAEDSTDTLDALEGLAALGTDAVYAPADGLEPSSASLLSRRARRSLAGTLPRRTRILSATGWGWWRTDPESRVGPWSRRRPEEIEPLESRL